MPHLSLSAALGVLVALAPLASLPAQKKVPKRPKLEAGADTNHGGTYYYYGLRVIDRRPQEAADAFYWASRLEPGWAQPLYGRRIALLMSDPGLMVRYMNRGGRARGSKEIQSIDSLLLRARMLDPYLTRDLDRTFIVAYITAQYEQALRRGGGPLDAQQRSELRFYIESYLNADASIWDKAWFAASERRFPEAIELYRKALGRYKEYAADIHAERGHVFYLIGSDDSARAALETALDELRKQDVKEFVRIYDSKAVLEHSVGLIHERRNDLEAAREAYGRALQEDLSYYPAHVRLGVMALAAGDTATALAELALAVELKGDEPSLRHTYGAVLTHVGKLEEAAEHLRKAVELEPLYATPYHLLGLVAEAAGKPAEALEHYQAYLARTHGRDANLAEVKRRVSALSAVAGKP